MIGQGFHIIDERKPGFPVNTLHDALNCSFRGLSRVLTEDIGKHAETRVFKIYSDLFTFVLLHLCTKKHFGRYYFGLYGKL